MSNTPLDNAVKTASKKKNYIVASVLLFLVLVVMAYIYARAVQKAPETLRNGRNAPTSDITEPASKPRSVSSETSTRLNDESPAKRVADEQEKIAKKNAIDKGNSHIDSTAALEEKAAKYAAEQTPPSLPEPPKPKPKQETVEPAKSKETLTREQLIAQRMNSLFTPNPALPPPPNYSAQVQSMFERINQLPETRAAYDSAQAQLYMPTGDNEQPLQAANSEQARYSNGKNYTATQQTNMPESSLKEENELVFSLGQMVLTELRWQVISDYSLPVFFDVVEPPYTKMTFMGNFELTQRQDGVLLRVTKLQMGKEVIPISGYGVNIATDLSPLFDQDVDSHFLERFLARASTAFVAPWIDFIGGSTTSIGGSNTTIVKDPVTETTDRVLGGFANVAKEFLPDLRKNANIPATVKVPDGYPVGVVFTSQVYLPKALLTNDPDSANSLIIGEY